MEKKIEEILCYLHTINDESFGFYAILDKYFIQNRTSNRKDFQHIPCENIKLNTLFIYRAEMEPGKMKMSCSEAPFDTYLKIVNDESMIKVLKEKEERTNDYLGLDIENELTPIEEALHKRIKEIRNEKLDIILDDSPKIAYIRM